MVKQLSDSFQEGGSDLKEDPKNDEKWKEQEFGTFVAFEGDGNASSSDHDEEEEKDSETSSNASTIAPSKL